MHLAAGERFGRYEIEETLGEGGMGTVYRAVDTRLGRRVALKVVRAGHAPDEVTRTRAATSLLHEARAAAALEHANAVSIYDVGQEGDTTFIAMELVVGQSLRASIGDPAVPLSTRVRWLRDIACVLEAAHARGLVHRDVKPENVMLRADGVVKVLDFGIALVRGDAAPVGEGPLGREQVLEAWRTTFTRDGVFVGTPRYMSPEQIDGEALDGRSDQFSWGVMAYELLSGKPPWLGDVTSLSHLFDIVDTEPAPLRTIAEDVPVAVERVVARALRKRPQDRFASMKDLVAALDAAPATRGGRRWAVHFGVAIAAASVVAAAVGLWRARIGGRPDRSSPAVGLTTAALTTTAPPTSRPTAISTFETAPHVVLLLDAAQGVVARDGVVSRWADQSELHNDAVAGVVAPTLVEHAIHGLPAVRFDRGQHLVVADAPSLQLALSDFTLEVVATNSRPQRRGVIGGYNLTTGYGMLYSKTAPQEPFAGLALIASFPHPVPSTRFGLQTSWEHYASTRAEGLNDGKPHLIGARRDGTALEIRLDGAPQGRVVLPESDDASAVGRPAFIGAQPKSEEIIQQLQGDIAELVLMRGTIGPATLAELEADLMKKYGLSPATE